MYYNIFNPLKWNNHRADQKVLKAVFYLPWGLGVLILGLYIWSPISCHFRYFKRRFQRPALLCGELHRDARLPRDARNVCWGSDPSSTNLPKPSKPLGHLGTTKKGRKKMEVENWSGTAGSNSGSNHETSWKMMKHETSWKMMKECPNGSVSHSYFEKKAMFSKGKIMKHRPRWPSR